MEDDLDMAEYHTTAQAAAKLGYSERRIRQKCATGEIKAKKLDRRWLIPRSVFEASLASPEGAEPEEQQRRQETSDRPPSTPLQGGIYRGPMRQTFPQEPGDLTMLEVRLSELSLQLQQLIDSTWAPYKRPDQGSSPGRVKP